MSLFDELTKQSLPTTPVQEGGPLHSPMVNYNPANPPGMQITPMVQQPVSQPLTTPFKLQPGMDEITKQKIIQRQQQPHVPDFNMQKPTPTAQVPYQLGPMAGATKLTLQNIQNQNNQTALPSNLDPSQWKMPQVGTTPIYTGPVVGSNFTPSPYTGPLQSEHMPAVQQVTVDNPAPVVPTTPTNNSPIYTPNTAPTGVPVPQNIGGNVQYQVNPDGTITVLEQSNEDFDIPESTLHPIVDANGNLTGDYTSLPQSKPSKTEQILNNITAPIETAVEAIQEKIATPEGVETPDVGPVTQSLLNLTGNPEGAESEKVNTAVNQGTNIALDALAGTPLGITSTLVNPTTVETPWGDDFNTGGGGLIGLGGNVSLKNLENIYEDHGLQADNPDGHGIIPSGTIPGVNTPLAISPGIIPGTEVVSGNTDLLPANTDSNGDGIISTTEVKDLLNPNSPVSIQNAQIAANKQAADNQAQEQTGSANATAVTDSNGNAVTTTDAQGNKSVVVSGVTQQEIIQQQQAEQAAKEKAAAEAKKQAEAEAAAKAAEKAAQEAAEAKAAAEALAAQQKAEAEAKAAAEAKAKAEAEAKAAAAAKKAAEEKKKAEEEAKRKADSEAAALAAQQQKDDNDNNNTGKSYNINADSSPGEDVNWDDTGVNWDDIINSTDDNNNDSGGGGGGGGGFCYIGGAILSHQSNPDIYGYLNACKWRDETRSVTWFRGYEVFGPWIARKIHSNPTIRPFWNGVCKRFYNHIQGKETVMSRIEYVVLVNGLIPFLGLFNKKVGDVVDGEYQHLKSEKELTGVDPMEKM